jgi:hypothetical protein
MREKATEILTALGIVAYFILAGAIPAGAQTTTIEFEGSDFYIPRPADRSDQVGVERLLASVDVPAELVGLACSVVGTSTNGESVHPNNYGMLRSNGDSVRIDGTEDTAQGVKLSDRTIVLGTTVRLFNVMLPDANGRVATSVNYTVRVTCTTDDTTTTTSPSSTTTSSPSTSTTTTGESTTTSSSIPPVTSTTVPTESTTTTAPPNTSTTAPGSTTTTFTWDSTTSSSIIEQDTSTTTQPTTDETLPHTGPPVEVAGIAMAGVALLLLGGAIVLGTRA